MNLDENSAVADRLNGILLVTKACEQDSCRDPWKTLHQDGSVRNLADALDQKYDDYYASLPRVAFGRCLPSLVPSNEEPYFPGFEINKGFANEYRMPDGPLPPNVYTQAINTTLLYGDYYEDLAAYESKARYLTASELSTGQPERRSFVY